MCAGCVLYYATRRLHNMTVTSTDRIEKNVVLHAPRARVWRALTTAEEFGAWFRVKLEGPFVEGAAVRGRITHPGYEQDRKSTRLNSSHLGISYAVFCLKKKKKKNIQQT